MARKKRIISSTGVYHIVIRGINRQVIFEDEYDFIQFINILKKCKDICGYKIYAYCLMDNHVHILLEEGEEKISSIMKKILLRYVIWYNRKYNRIGPLFQDRFHSEVVEDTAYLLTASRYIFQNPLKARIVSDIAKYRWSDYNAYWIDDGFTSTDQLKRMFSSFSAFEDFMKSENNDKCLEAKENERKKYTDEEIKKIARQILGDISLNSISSMNRMERNNCIVKLKRAGIGSIQISRLTGVSKSIVQKV